MHARTTLTLLCTAGALLAGCRADGNDRSALGTPGSPNAVVLSNIHGAGTRSETPRRDDTPSIAGLSRAAWSRQSIVVPVEGTYAMRRYARSYQITDTTARQRGDFPTPLSSLELTGGTRDDQAVEILAAGPYAFYEGLVLIPRLFFVPPCEEVRATPQEHWRAPVSTARYTLDERTPEAAAETDAAAAPR
ncbi:MAG TPA: hypothetical protein VHN77_04625 [Phycisphaerales bacterium]|nr:hypothetical protein [Phycisphaerales bacterium]